MSRDGLIAGLLILTGVTQFMIFMIVSEALYPNYSVAYNYISDLGVGITAPIFNTSIIFLGLTVIISSYFLNRLVRDRVFSITILLTGVGAVGVGVFPEGSPYNLHYIVSAVTFIFAGLSAIVSSRTSPKHIGILSIILGISSLTALILFALEMYLGLGHGGMERMIVYPIFSWALMYAGYMMSR
ncbi:MAG: DUF998 domain-containing protein [Nitrososphaeria archaeon]|nr:DUF998 domain-containing protein [Nitrososphaeria archaeon]